MMEKTLSWRMILNHSYHAAKVTSFCNYTMKTLTKQPLLVYQMGKVGSSTIIRSLRNSAVAQPVFQVHALSDAAIRFDEQLYWGDEWGSKFNIFRRSKLPVTQHLYVSYYFRWLLARGRPNPMHRWKIVTLVRDPVARNISGFFQGIAFHIPDFYLRLEAEPIEVDELIDSFLEKYWHDVPLVWFDRELKSSLDIDVYAIPFPKTRGYSFISDESVDLLLIRLENLEECYREAFGKFLGSDLELESQNLSEMKVYSSLYREFRDSIILPSEYLDRMYCSKYARHFYNYEEISRFRYRWSAQ